MYALKIHEVKRKNEVEDLNELPKTKITKAAEAPESLQNTLYKYLVTLVSKKKNSTTYKNTKYKSTKARSMVTLTLADN